MNGECEEPPYQFFFFTINFDNWSGAGDRWFVYKRIYWNYYKWTPFCKVYFRYIYRRFGKKLCPECGRPMIAETANYLPIWYCVEHELCIPVKRHEMKYWKKCDARGGEQ